MNTLMEKVSAYIAEMSMEKDATSIQSVRNATAHSIRGLRKLRDAQVLDKYTVNVLKDHKLSQAGKIVDKARHASQASVPGDYLISSPMFESKGEMGKYLSYKKGPAMAERALRDTKNQLSRMVPDYRRETLGMNKSTFKGVNNGQRGMQIPRVDQYGHGSIVNYK